MGPLITRTILTAILLISPKILLILFGLLAYAIFA
jgi:hypothetical protein